MTLLKSSANALGSVIEFNINIRSSHPFDILL